MTYKVVKYVFKGRNRTIYTGLTLEEAKEICSNPKTSGHGWFYGFTKE